LAAILLVTPMLSLACATGSGPTDEGNGSGSSINDTRPGDDGGASAQPARHDAGRAKDSGGSYLPPDAGPNSDAGESVDAATAVDSSTAPDTSTPPDPDSGPPATATGDDCTGTTSSQLGIPYDQACDNYFINSLGDSNPCTVGGTECNALNTASTTYCCYKAPSGSSCAQDYSSKPQCVPQ
jgi:hypothetical protein